MSYVDVFVRFDPFMDRIKLMFDGKPLEDGVGIYIAHCGRCAVFDEEGIEKVLETLGDVTAVKLGRDKRYIAIFKKEASFILDGERYYSGDCLIIKNGNEVDKSSEEDQIFSEADMMEAMLYYKSGLTDLRAGFNEITAFMP